MSWRLRAIFVVSWTAMTLTWIVWFWSWFAWPEAHGIALGFRRWHSEYDLVIGVSGGGSSFQRSEIWYFKTIIPWPPGDRMFDRAHRLGSHADRGVFGFELISYFPNGRHWYCGFILPFWALAGIAGVGIWQSRRLLRRQRY